MQHGLLSCNQGVRFKSLNLNDSNSSVPFAKGQFTATCTKKVSSSFADTQCNHIWLTRDQLSNYRVPFVIHVNS